MGGVVCVYLVYACVVCVCVCDVRYVLCVFSGREVGQSW